MRIALFKPRPVYVDHILYRSRLALLAYDLFANRYPPLGLLQLAAVLERAGHDVRVVDCEQKFLNAAAAAHLTRSFAPQLIAISAYIFNPAADLAFAGRLKELLGGPPLLVTGHFPREYAGEALRHNFVDFALTGKGFAALPALVAAIEKGRAPDGVPGLAFRKNGTVFRAAAEPFKIEGLPHAARHLVDNRFYTSGLAHRRLITTILGSIGCPHRCYHCPEHLIRYRARPVRDIVDEIAAGQERFWINEWCFLDPIFNVSKERVMAFCQALLDRRVAVSWTIKARADLMDAEMLSAMKRAGCTRIGYGIESGDQGELDRLGRRMDLAAARRTLALTREHGIPTIAYFMVGNYDDTAETLERTREFIADLPADNILIATTTPLPGSALHAEICAVRGEDPWLMVARGRPIDPEAFRPPRAKLNAADLNRFTAQMYRKFYARPGFVADAFFMRGSHRGYVLRGIQNAALNLGALGIGLAARLKAFSS